MQNTEVAQYKLWSFQVWPSSAYFHTANNQSQSFPQLHNLIKFTHHSFTVTAVFEWPYTLCVCVCFGLVVDCVLSKCTYVSATDSLQQ